jgi:hypothetical protein
MPFRSKLVTCGLALLASGCATVSSTKLAPADEAVVRYLAVPCKDVRVALQPALLRLGFSIEDVVEESDCGLKLVAVMGPSAAAIYMLSGGEVVRVSVQKETDVSTMLQITTKRRVAMDPWAKGDWSGEIVKALHAVLGR